MNIPFVGMMNAAMLTGMIQEYRPHVHTRIQEIFKNRIEWVFSLNFSHAIRLFGEPFKHLPHSVIKKRNPRWRVNHIPFRKARTRREKQGFKEDRRGLDALNFGYNNHQNLVTQSDVMISICYNHGGVHSRCITRTSTILSGIVRTGHIIIAAIPD